MAIAPPPGNPAGKRSYNQVFDELLDLREFPEFDPVAWLTAKTHLNRRALIATGFLLTAALCLFSNDAGNAAAKQKSIADQITSQLLFFFVLYVLSTYARTTAPALLEATGLNFRSLPRTPTFGAVSLMTFAAGVAIVCYFRAAASGPNPFTVAAVLKWIVWLFVVLPISVEWFASVFVIVINAGTIVLNRLYEAKVFHPDRLSNAGRVRDWINTQLIHYLLFLVAAIFALGVDPWTKGTKSLIQVLLAFSIPVFLTIPLVSTWSLMDQFRGRRMKELGRKIATDERSLSTDAFEYFILMSTSEPFWRSSIYISIVGVVIALWDKAGEQVKRIGSDRGSIFAVVVTLAIIVLLVMGYLRHQRKDEELASQLSRN